LGGQSERERWPLPRQLGSCLSASVLGWPWDTYLARMAFSLRIRWLWRMHTDLLQPWRDLDMHFSSVKRVVFDTSTSMVVGTGRPPSSGRQMVGSTNGWMARPSGR
jgi:hypothetical protein